MKKTISSILFALILESVLCASILPQNKIKIAVIPKCNTSLFWKSVHAGAKFGAMASRDIEIIWKGPQTESSTEQQIAIVDQFIKEGVSGIILSPISYEALVEPVTKAMKKNIPVLIFDSALKGTTGKDFISFVGIDNKKAGGLAGDHLARLLGNKGKVVLLRYVEGQANTTEREEGFLNAISRHDGIRVIAKEQYTDGTVDGAKKASLNLIDRLKEADGVFCPNEPSTMGMLLALREASLIGKVKFIGFDSPKPIIEGLEKGEIDALIIQNPSHMGFLSVKTLVDKIHGKKIPLTFDVGVQLITSKDLNDPDVKKILALPSLVEDGS